MKALVLLCLVTFAVNLASAKFISGVPCAVLGKIRKDGILHGRFCSEASKSTTEASVSTSTHLVSGNDPTEASQLEISHGNSATTTDGRIYFDEPKYQSGQTTPAPPKTSTESRKLTGNQQGKCKPNQHVDLFGKCQDTF